ncbi:MAG: T9SS type A sorting domain-containing protein [Bacteroidetes bacterium]|nr:T9SS type A sorting domain-containing protein [Bacteroidota bacterium]
MNRKSIALTLIFHLCFVLTASMQAQMLVSRFDFNALPLTAATAGPNGTYANPSATTGGSGVRFASSGSNVGLDLVVPGATFDDGSIDVVIEYSRNESQATFFERGATKFYMDGGNLYFNYRVYRSTRRYSDYVLGPVSAQAFGTSGVYTTIRVLYAASTGEAAVFINGVRVLYNDGPDGRDLYWVSAGDMTIGGIMDGSGNNFETLGSIAFWIGNVSALPVELVSFSGAMKHEGVVLRWKTATELNNFGFEVQRSTDRKNWETIDFVPGYGTSNSPKSYDCTDADALRSDRPVLYYRLRQVDRDGSDDFSSVLEIPLAELSSFLVHPARPNPFNPSTVIGLAIDHETTVSMAVYDATGREVARILTNEVLPVGYHDIPFNADQLPSGIYFAMVSSDHGMQTVKLVLQK